MNRGMHYIKTTCFVALITLLAGCTSMQVDHSKTVAVPDNDFMVVFPISNLTETPQADEKATAIATNLLRIKGFSHVAAYPVKTLKPALIPGVKVPVKEAVLLAWARDQGARYALSGSVNEWNYKVGMDGEPVVGMNLELINVDSGKHIWSAVGSESGGSRTAVSEVAIHLMQTMLGSIESRRV
jgi:TolB-like protein